MWKGVGVLPPSIGNYTLLRLLGRGGMAEVWLARRADPLGVGQLVVLKRILEQESTNRKFVDAFIDEARLSARLHHPNIVLVHEVGLDGQQPFLVLELVDGIDLEQLLDSLALQGQRLPVTVAVHIAVCLLRALAYAHRLVDEAGQPLEVIHRDVSPPNVLLGRGGEVKLGDFGIAKARGRLSKTAFGLLKGKAQYMSPEQAQGHKLDHRSDLFSVGAVLWECLAGRRLFDAGDDFATLRSVQAAQVAALVELRDEVDAGLNAVVLRLLARKPEDRYPDADTALLALSDTGWLRPEAFGELDKLVTEAADKPLSQMPTPTDLFAAEPESPVLPPRKRRRRFGRRAIAATALLVMAVAVGAVWFGSLRLRSPELPGRAPDLSRAGVIVNPGTAGALVFWDDRFLGAAPQTVNQTPDKKRHTIKLLRRGFATWQKNIPFNKARTVDRNETMLRQAGTVMTSTGARNSWTIAGRHLADDEQVTLPAGLHLAVDQAGRSLPVMVYPNGITTLKAD